MKKYLDFYYSYNFTTSIIASSPSCAPFGLECRPSSRVCSPPTHPPPRPWWASWRTPRSRWSRCRRGRRAWSSARCPPQGSARRSWACTLGTPPLRSFRPHQCQRPFREKELTSNRFSQKLLVVPLQSIETRQLCSTWKRSSSPPLCLDFQPDYCNTLPKDVYRGPQNLITLGVAHPRNAHWRAILLWAFLS